MTEPNKQEFVSPLTEHLRQYQHNDCSGIVFGYDKAGIDKLFASLNKQPPAEAGEGVVGVYVGHNQNGFGEFEEHSEQQDSSSLKLGDLLYTSQTTATKAAVAAAMRKCAEIAKSWEKSPATGEPDATALAIEEEIRSSIPVEANAALEKICMEVALRAEKEGWNRAVYSQTPGLHAIVRDVLNKNREG